MGRIAKLLSTPGKYELMRGAETSSTMRTSIVVAGVCMSAVLGLWLYTVTVVVPRLPESVALPLTSRGRGSPLRLPTEVYVTLSWWMLAVGFAMVVAAAAFSYWSPWRSMLVAVIVVMTGPSTAIATFVAVLLQLRRADPVAGVLFGMSLLVAVIQLLLMGAGYFLAVALSRRLGGLRKRTPGP